MKSVHFETLINAPAQKVWSALWDDASYREWTRVFSEGSYAQSDWVEGGRIWFLDGSGRGMYSNIEKLEPNRFMWFRHLGEIRDGQEQPVVPGTSWENATENYTLQQENGATKLMVDLTGAADAIGYFQGIFPKALERVKEIAER